MLEDRKAAITPYTLLFGLGVSGGENGLARDVGVPTYLAITFDTGVIGNTRDFDSRILSSSLGYQATPVWGM